MRSNMCLEARLQKLAGPIHNLYVDCFLLVAVVLLVRLLLLRGHFCFLLFLCFFPHFLLVVGTSCDL